MLKKPIYQLALEYISDTFPFDFEDKKHISINEIEEYDIIDKEFALALCKRNVVQFHKKNGEIQIMTLSLLNFLVCHFAVIEYMDVEGLTNLQIQDVQDITGLSRNRVWKLVKKGKLHISRTNNRVYFQPPNLVHWLLSEGCNL